MYSINAHAKVNIFLKITGTRGVYHEIISRFMRVENFYDSLFFEKKEQPNEVFEIVGEFGCNTQQNTIYKAYRALLQHTSSKQLKEFFHNHRVCVEKKIPAFAGLGGGSSDAATFLQMCNQEMNLGLDTPTLAEIGLRVGADVPFFVYGYKSANVSGIGEIVKPFDEESLAIKTITPEIQISTPHVYKVYREMFLNPLTQEQRGAWESKTSLEVLKTYSAKEANDLFAPALQAYKELAHYAKEGYFFSGSGSSFFWIEGESDG